MSGLLDSLRIEAALPTVAGSLLATEFADFLRTEESTSGAQISFDSAMRISAVHAAVRIISESLASLPLIIYRRLPNGGKERAVDHPLWSLLHDRPNSLQTSFEWRETVCNHLLLKGNAYSFKVSVQGRLHELLPIHPDMVSVELKRERVLVFKVEDAVAGSTQEFQADRIFHLKALSSNGYTGRSVISDARDSLGATMAMEEHGARTFRNSAQLKGVFEMDGTLRADEKTNFLDSWKQNHTGFVNAGKTPLLEAGIKFKPISMSLEDAQFVEARRFQISEIARIFRVPLHMLADFQSQPRANMEQAALEFVQNTLRPWAVRLEQAINVYLLESDPGHFVEHLFDALLRGDIKTRSESYGRAIQWGWMNRDEVRAKENLNPLPDGIGQQYLQPLNMGLAGQNNATP